MKIFAEKHFSGFNFLVTVLMSGANTGHFPLLKAILGTEKSVKKKKKKKRKERKKKKDRGEERQREREKEERVCEREDTAYNLSCY